MFDLSNIPPVPYEAPWLLPLQTRLRMLAMGRRRVAYLYEVADDSTFRYRVYNMTQVLNDGSRDISASYFFMADLSRMDEIVDLADLLVVCRTRYDDRVIQLVGAFKRYRKPVLFDIDDLVFDLDYVHIVIESLDLDIADQSVWDEWFAYSARLGATLKQCDGAITTTETLAARISDFAGIPVSVVPNFMNREQLALSERVFDAKRERAPGESGLIHLGYFSGSPTHDRDFAIVAPVLEELLEEEPQLGVIVVGYIAPGANLERFGSRVHRMPLQDFVNLQRVIGTVEFNLMPLQFNAFTNCKSELKYFEAAAVGTVSIASPTEVYARAIRDGDTGYLARTHEWKRVIRRALSAIDGYGSMAARGRDEALARYACHVQRARVITALGFPS